MGNASTIFRGDTSPQLQWQKREFDPQRGYVYYYDLKGLSQAAMILTQNQFSAQGIESSLTLEHDIAMLSAVDSTQTFTIDSWQVVSQDESFDGLSHPNLLTALNGSLDVIAAMREHLDINDSLLVFENDPAYVKWSSNNPGASAISAVSQFYLLQQRGSTEYRNPQYVLKHTTNAPANWQGNPGQTQGNVADVGVNTIYTPAQAFSEVTNPALWILPLPVRLQTKLGFVPVQVPQPADPVQYLWGFLKSPSTESTSANNRVEIITEYTLALWSTILYTPFSNWVMGSNSIPWPATVPS